MSINVVTLSGNLSRDPETRWFQDGKSITIFSIAVQSFRKGEKTTFWMDCKAWGKVGEVCGEYLKEGSLVTVSGSLEHESWETESGGKRGKLVLNVKDVQLPPKWREYVEPDLPQFHELFPNKDY